MFVFSSGLGQGTEIIRIMLRINQFDKRRRREKWKLPYYDKSRRVTSSIQSSEAKKISSNRGRTPAELRKKFTMNFSHLINCFSRVQPHEKSHVFSKLESNWWAGLLFCYTFCSNFPSGSFQCSGKWGAKQQSSLTLKVQTRKRERRKNFSRFGFPCDGIFLNRSPTRASNIFSRLLHAIKRFVVKWWWKEEELGLFRSLLKFRRCCWCW